MRLLHGAIGLIAARVITQPACRGARGLQFGDASCGEGGERVSARRRARARGNRHAHIAHGALQGRASSCAIRALWAQAHPTVSEGRSAHGVRASRPATPRNARAFALQMARSRRHIVLIGAAPGWVTVHVSSTTDPPWRLSWP